MCRPIRACWSRKGGEAANRLASRVFTLLLLSQIVLLVAALVYTDELVALIAPGFSEHPEKFALAVGMTRITFPYLAFITLATLHSGTLNAHGYFSAAAFAPVLLNLFVAGFLAVAFLFPNAGVAACWGVFVSGIAQLALLMAEARRRGVLERLAVPRLDPDVKQFFAALGPAVIGSAGQQIAILADTILASLLPNNANSSMYYAERLYQLPLGVIGVAAGTVLLPEMSRRLAAGDARGAAAAQNRSIALTLRPRRAVLRRLSRAARGDDARRLPARRLHRPGGARLGRGARRLRARAGADGAHPLGGGELPVARRHDDADAVLLRRAGGQSRAQARPLPADGARRPRRWRRPPAPGSISPC